MALFSQNGQTPRQLPFRIVLPSGQTRTDPTTFTEQEIADAGFVEVADKPDIDPAVETVSWIDGAWQVVAIPLDDLKTAKRGEINAKLEEVLSGGYTVPSMVSAALAGKVLQTRNVDDRTNWLTSQASYSAAVAGGQGSTMGAMFRTEDNSKVTMTYAEGYNVLLAMAEWGAATYANSWSLKDAVAAAEDNAALDAIDIEAGWPA